MPNPSNPLIVNAGILTQGPALNLIGSPNNVSLYYSGALAVYQNSINVHGAGSVVRSSGNYQVGSAGFFTAAGFIVPGVWAYWVGTGALTLDVSLWAGPWVASRSAYTKVASGSAPVNASGWYYVPFSSPYAITSGGTGWAATTYESSGTYYAAGGTYVGGPSTGVPVQAGPSVWYDSWECYSSGNTNPPSSTASTESYLVDPVVVAATTTTTASYTQPAVGSTVAVSVVSATGMVPGTSVNIVAGGLYRLVSVSGATLTLVNVSDASTGVGPGAVVASGVYVY